MSRNTSRIDVHHTSDSVNEILPSSDILSSTEGSKGLTSSIPTIWYNQSEDQFIQLTTPLKIPSFPVHHDIHNYSPPEQYEIKLRHICTQCVSQYPAIFAGTTWAFDPTSILTPYFYRIETYEDTHYLYMCRIDLTARPLETEMIEQGSNAHTHSYRTNRLYIECDWFPLAGTSDTSLEIATSIPATWKGEAGQGYMIHGIWMDSDINKFFSKLILPSGTRNHPFYPLTCKRHCVSMNAFGQNGPQLLHHARTRIEPALEEILTYLNNFSFSEIAPIFTSLKKEFEEDLLLQWKTLVVRPYLNERDSKEYQVDF